MTISTKVFHHLQSGVKAADDLRVRGPINDALDWLGKGLPDELNTQFASISVSLSQISQSTSVQVAAAISEYVSTNPVFSAHKNGTDQTSITTATFTKLTFPTEVTDVGGYYNAATSTYTPPSGQYLFIAQAMVTAGLVDQQQIVVAIYKNGSVSHQGPTRRNSGTGLCSADAAVIESANGTDAFDAYVFADGAGNKTVSGVATVTFFQGYKL